MKKLVALVVVMVCAVSLTGCPTSKTTKDKNGTKDKAGAVKLTVKTNKDSYSVTQGDKVEVDVTIDRTGFDDDVMIAFKDLPKGVTGPTDAKIAKGGTKGSYNLTAAPDAEVTENAGVQVEAKGGGIDAKHAITITVKKK